MSGNASDGVEFICLRQTQRAPTRALVAVSSARAACSNALFIVPIDSLAYADGMERADICALGPNSSSGLFRGRPAPVSRAFAASAAA